LPWGIPISVQRQREVAGQEFGPDARFHPTFAYEMIWDLMNFGVLMWLGRQKRFKLREGDLLWIYLVIYSIGRFAIEAIRVDSARVSGIAIPQIIAILTIVFAWLMFIIRHRPGSTAAYSESNLPDGWESSTAAVPGTPGPSVASNKASRLRKVPASLLESDKGSGSANLAATPTAGQEPSTESP